MTMSLSARNLASGLLIAAVALTAPLSLAKASGAFEAFGGTAGIQKVTDDFVDLLYKDPRIDPFFKDTNERRLRRTLAEQFCVELEGPCTYSGRDMKSSHKGFDIRMEHFNGLVEVLQVAMDRNDVPFWAQNKLLAKLAPMYRDIVGNGG